MENIDGVWHTLVSLMIRGKHGIQCMPCFSRIISEMLSEIHTTDKCEFLKTVIYSKIGLTSA